MREVNALKLLSDQYKATAEDIERRLYMSPYYKVVQKLQSVRSFEDPLKKAKKLKEAIDLISISINEFWRGLDIPSDKLVLDAD